MSPEAAKLRDLILSGTNEGAEIDFEEIRARIAGLPLPEIGKSVTLLAAFAAATDDPKLRIAALVRLARMARDKSQEPKRKATEAARLRAQAKRDKLWAEKYGPGFDLYDAIARAARNLGVNLNEMVQTGTYYEFTDEDGTWQEPDYYKKRVPSKAYQREIIGLVKRELIQRYPEKWSERTKLSLDKSAFEGAKSAATRLDFEAFSRPG